MLIQNVIYAMCDEICKEKRNGVCLQTCRDTIKKTTCYKSSLSVIVYVYRGIDLFAYLYQEAYIT